MKNEHLTDEEIQQMAVEPETGTPAMHKHLLHCSHCARQATQYRLLMQGLHAMPHETFDFDISAAVMARLPQEQKKTDKWLAGVLVMAMVAMLVTVIILAGQNLVQLFVYLQPVLVYLIATGTICLMAFLGLDTYRKYKEQMKTLNFYS